MLSANFSTFLLYNLTNASNHQLSNYNLVRSIMFDSINKSCSISFPFPTYLDVPEIKQWQTKSGGVKVEDVDKLFEIPHSIDGNNKINNNIMCRDILINVIFGCESTFWRL